MDYKQRCTLILILLSILTNAQNSIDDALKSIAINNKMLISAKQIVEAKSLEYHTGITLVNPLVTVDYMIGKPVSGGNQLEFLVVQNFDFPTVYPKKKELADKKAELLKIELRETIQNTLFEAKILSLDLIYLNKQKLILERRKNSSEALLAAYQLKFDKNELSLIDLNKAKFQLLGIKNRLRTINSQLIINSDHLTEMNGGIPISIVDTLYPIELKIPTFESVHDSIEANDPNLKWLEYQITIYQSKQKINKALTLPSFEAGYHYQSVLGQTFNGVHIGMTIPLWERKNTIKAADSHIQHATYQYDGHKLEHFYGIRESYEDYQNLKQTLLEYKEVISSLNSEVLLAKSLSLGEISFITYSTELQYYYTIYDQFLLIENQYQKAVAQLFKYQL